MPGKRESAGDIKEPVTMFIYSDSQYLGEMMKRQIKQIRVTEEMFYPKRLLSKLSDRQVLF